MIIEYKLSLKHSLLPLQDKIQYRRKAILELKLKGLTNVVIASKLQYDVSTIERDLHQLRKVSSLETLCEKSSDKSFESILQFEVPVVSGVCVT